MIHFVFLEQIRNDEFLDLVVIGSTEFLAALFSKLVFKLLTRKVSLILLQTFVLTCFFFLLIFKSNI